jgi:uncharacterized pyridoxal phosphate-containing UPF0001 family protein
LEEMKQEQSSYKKQISEMKREQEIHKEQISQLQKSKVDLASQLFDAKHRIEFLEMDSLKLHKEIEGKNKFIESHLAFIVQNTNEILRKQNRRLSL